MNASITDTIFSRRSQQAGVFLPSAGMADFARQARDLAGDRYNAQQGRDTRRRFDGCDTPAQVKARQLFGEYEPFLADVIREVRGGKFDDADMAVATEALTYFYQRTRDRRYADLPAYLGEVLPIDDEVDPGAESYVWWDRDLHGHASVASTYNEDSIPTVGGPTGTPNRGTVRPFLNCWRTNFRTAIREALIRRNGKPDFRNDEGKEEAADRAHAEAINAQWLWGDKQWGIPGLMKETRIRVIPSPPTGNGGSTSWFNKQVDQVILDLLTGINSIHQYSNKSLRTTRLLLPQTRFDFIAGLRIGGTTDTVLSYIDKIQQAKKQPVEIKGLQELDVANSSAYNGGPPELAFNRMVAIAVDKNAASFVLSVRPEVPMPPKNTGLGEVHFKHSRAGGLKLEDAESIVFVDGI